MGIGKFILPFVFGLSSVIGFGQELNFDCLRKLEKFNCVGDKEKVSLEACVFDSISFENPYEDESRNYLDGKDLNVYFQTKKLV